MARSPRPDLVVQGASPAGGAADGPLSLNLLKSLRPEQWTKNLVIFAGLIFGRHLLDRQPLARTIAAFVVFCALSGAVYLVNDVVDREADRCHPLKAKRPIASGAVPVGTALAAALVLTVAALAAALWLGPIFCAVSAAYVGLQTLYSL